MGRERRIFLEWTGTRWGMGGLSAGLPGALLGHPGPSLLPAAPVSPIVGSPQNPSRPPTRCTHIFPPPYLFSSWLSDSLGSRDLSSWHPHQAILHKGIQAAHLWFGPRSSPGPGCKVSHYSFPQRPMWDATKRRIKVVESLLENLPNFFFGNCECWSHFLIILTGRMK
jgi:hypothetical protein